jgi:hypothetical protein
MFEQTSNWRDQDSGAALICEALKPLTVNPVLGSDTVISMLAILLQS